MIKQGINRLSRAMRDPAFPANSGIPLWRKAGKIQNVSLRHLGFISLSLLAFLISAIARINLAVPLFLTSLYAYIKFRRLNLKDYKLPNITLLFLISFSASLFIIRKGLPIYYLPFSVIPMLTTMLFSNLELSLLVVLAISVSAAAISANFPQVLLLSLISGILSSILVQGGRKRTTVIRAGFILGILEGVGLIFIEHFIIRGPSRYIILMLNGVLSSIIVLGVLPVFEYLFKTVTNISLLELADFHHPLLQRMILEAPGTYHHSLVVGNLSETACEAVGANALLARIGSYYHDIGKIAKPGYFSENQGAEMSKHDTLAPTMSKLVIMNHVKEGLELAKKYRLHPPIIDFILKHHGNSLVYYFYRRAMEGLEEDQEIKEEGFRYPGPRPNTKETAVVLLADSVEAATRALKDPTPSKIEELVHKVINNKFIDGQLDECDLTLKDLEKISAVFIRILSGIYRSRVTYPEELKSGNSHKKFSKENSHQSEKDKKSNS
ncbi:MAG: HDIG domain-containing protein [Candidatus Omnitrophica bacterium]|nr:HDIG domain-containing protein [Candidatus Omnitrophota bacterium]